MIIETGRFGQLTIGSEELITIPQGILGFPEYKKYCLVDPGDETLILWLHSVENPQIAFPVLEPKIFKPDYTVRLSSAELRELKLENINQSAVFSILTFSEDVTKMTANLKAPLVVNLKEQIAKQVVLQENDYSIKYEMFKELKTHLVTIESQRRIQSSETDAGLTQGLTQGSPQALPQSSPQSLSQNLQKSSVVAIRNIPPSLTVKNLEQ